MKLKSFLESTQYKIIAEIKQSINIYSNMGNGPDFMCGYITCVKEAERIIHSYGDDIDYEKHSDLIDRKAFRQEVESLRMAITGIRSGETTTSQALEEYKKSILRIVDEQPTVVLRTILEHQKGER